MEWNVVPLCICGTSGGRGTYESFEGQELYGERIKSSFVSGLFS